MAGMTDSAFRRLVKRQGGCGLVVTEMVSSEGLVRGIDRTLEYAEYTEEERPVSIQIFGGDPDKMAAAAQIVEGMGADIVDVNMGCPVPKIAKHNAGCSLMREPEHAASVIDAMAKAVRIPVTVKMRAGWNDDEPQRADAGEDGRGRRGSGVAVHGRTAAAELQRIGGLGSRRASRRCAHDSRFGSGDCVSRSRSFIGPGRGSKASSSAAACCGIHGFWRRRGTSPPGALSGSHVGSRSIPARLHRPADERTSRRSQRTRPRQMDGGQGPCARVVLHEGPGRRLSPADGHQFHNVSRGASGVDRRVLWLRNDGGQTVGG